VAVSDLKGGVVGRREGIFRPANDMAARLTVLKESIFALLKELGIGVQDLLKIICIAPGIYAERGKALKWTPNYQEAPGQDLGEFFQRVFKRKVIMNHSTKLSLLGEKIAGKAKGFDNVVYVDFAYGLGCAIMIDGRIHFGSQASAGEIGYFYSSVDEFLSATVKPYQLGCLEQRISGKALQEKAAQYLLNGGGGKIAEMVEAESGTPSGKVIFDAHKLGDPEATRILREAFAYFNLALCNTINLLAPELIILGGGFSRAGEVLMELVSREIRDRVLVMPRLEVSELKNQASLIGGVQYLIDHTDLLAEL
jgi:predicted NBD/HSP70 family sugar kinase